MIRILSFSLIFFSLFLFSCKEGTAPSGNLVRFSGETMGTTYSVLFPRGKPSVSQEQLDSLLQEINMGVSTYIPTSVISRFNQADSIFVTAGSASRPADRYFEENYSFAEQVVQSTEGYFDPTVMPLVNYWGFGYTPKRKVEKVDSLLLDSLLLQVGMQNISRSQQGDQMHYRKSDKGVQLDFSALAKGYGVDILGKFLEKQEIPNYLVEIGGEVRCRGEKSQGKLWRIGVNTPREEAGLQDFEVLLELRDKSMATSGNYRNYYEVEGVKYSHTINPKTGLPERSRLLSTTVLAKDCMMADAYATAFMVMGLEKAFAFVEKDPQLEALFIFSDEKGDLLQMMTEGVKEMIVKGER